MISARGKVWAAEVVVVKRFGSGIERAGDAEDVLAGHVGINHDGLHTAVAEQFLDRPDVLTTLEQLGLWAPEASAPGPPAAACDWPVNARMPLTYHPVPDIA